MMVIDLEKEAMESIVKDGVKEIMKQVVGSSQGAKKAGWFQVVKVAELQGSEGNLVHGRLYWRMHLNSWVGRLKY